MTDAAAAAASSGNNSSSIKHAAVKSELSVDAAVAVKAETTGHHASVKQLKLQLFQELSHRRRHEYPHAWSQYWRALQQFLLARVAVDEFQCLMELLLGDDRDLVELHNAFLIAILTQAHDSSKAPAADASVHNNNSSKASDVVETKATSSSGTSPTAVHTERSKSSKRARSNSASARDDARTVKKLLHFAHSKRSPRAATDASSSSTQSQDADAQSAELLMGLGAGSSRASRDDTAQASHKTH